MLLWSLINNKPMGCKRSYVSFIVLFVIFSHLCTPLNGGEVDDESEFSYSDESGKGPEHWAKISPEWETCGSGKLQSPIDLADDRVVVSQDLGSLRRTYKPAPAVMKNRGHDVVVTWNGDAGGIEINGTEVKLVQCHWHTPSEHTLNGKRFKMEIHLVHENPRGEIAVVGIMYKLGRADKFLDKVLQRIKGHGHEEINAGMIDPWDIKFGSRKYFRYMGSLSVPPCTEGVFWSILNKVRTVSRDQIRALKQVVHDGFEENARPVQQWNDRPLYMFHPGDKQ